MGIYHPLRRTGLRVSVTVLCLVLLSGVVPKHLSGWLLKPLFGWNWFAFFHVFPLRAPKEIVAGILCATGYVRRAMVQVEDERAAVEAERDAFSEFAESVREMDALSHTSFDAPTAALVSPSPDHEQLRTIRSRYRETVMAVPGYDREYGESLRENMTAEFGEEVTTAILDGEQFTPKLKNLLVGRAVAAARQREALMEAIDGEHSSLIDARQRLETAEIPLEAEDELELSEESFEALIDYDRRSRREETRCEKLLTDRQRHVHRKTRWLHNADAAFLQEYLYHDFDVRFPVLHAGLERIERLRERRRVVSRAIARLD